MANITITDLETNVEMDEKALSRIAGGNYGLVRGMLPPALERRLFGFAGNLTRAVRFTQNPRRMYRIIRRSQRAYRRLYGRQMPYFRTQGQVIGMIRR